MTRKFYSTFLLAGLGLSLAGCASANSTSQSDPVQTSIPPLTTSPNNHSDDEQAVLSILDQISKASVAKDVTTLDQILPDNYVLIHMTSYKQSKADWLAEVASGSMEYFAGDGNSTSNQTVTIDGDTATVSSKGTVEAKIGTGGRRRTWNISSTATFKKINGNWVIQETDATK